MFAIDPATGMRSTSNTTLYSLAGRSSSGLGIEGPTMAWHDGYYYLFTSWDVCCQGVSSTYNTRVVRSANITGPYVDKNGASAAYGTGNGTLWLSRYGRYIGPGGGTCYKQGERDFMVHHYYDGDNNGNAELLFREIVWGDDGWPIAGQPFLGRYLSAEAEHAVLANDTILESATASDGEYVSGTSTVLQRVLRHGHPQRRRLPAPHPLRERERLPARPVVAGEQPDGDHRELPEDLRRAPSRRPTPCRWTCI
jgi:arabinan endo-1,5-alpha-L-arabinosidase